MARPKKTTGKIQRTYLVYYDGDSNKITLSFRSEESLRQHIKERKICENDILYVGNMRPQNQNSEKRSSCINRTIDRFYEYIYILVNNESGVVVGKEAAY